MISKFVTGNWQWYIGCGCDGSHLPTAADGLVLMLHKFEVSSLDL